MDEQLHNRPSEPLEPVLIDPRRFEWHDEEGPPPRQMYQPPVLRSRKKLALFLFAATCLSTFYVGGLSAVTKESSFSVSDGFWYMLPVMSILLAHELGHYVQALRYRVPATLPYFIPLPIRPLGTMGAVIVQGAQFADRKALFDIAISGPLAGLVLALPISYYGLHHVKFIPIEEVPPDDMMIGIPMLYRWMFLAIHGMPPEGMTVDITPVAFAGWVGIFITALNLIPIGQLDGGHILYTLIGRRAHRVAWSLIFAAFTFMILTGYIAYGLMLVLLIMMGPKHPPTADDTVPLGWGRVILGWLTLAFIIVGFTPMPLIPGKP